MIPKPWVRYSPGPSRRRPSVLFLASDEAAAYTASNLVIDRGSLVGSYPKLPPDTER